MNERTKQVGEGKQTVCHLRLLYALLTTSFLVVSEQPGLAVDFRVDGFSKTTIFPGAFTGKTNTTPNVANRVCIRRAVMSCHARGRSIVCAVQAR